MDSLDTKVGTRNSGMFPVRGTRYFGYRLSLLEEVYRIYHDFMSGIKTACKKRCSTCCTRNATMTSLEGQFFLSQINGREKEELISRLKIMDQGKRYQPKITINQLADLCMKGEDVPDEEKDDQSGACYFLKGDLCTVYPERPFHCRCMVSITRCEESGFANMDEFILTVNNLFLQIIEHLDSNGYTGNLVDILLYLNSDSKRKNDAGKIGFAGRWSLIHNRPAKILMIPPEHRKKVNPLLSSLKKIILRFQD